MPLERLKAVGWDRVLLSYMCKAGHRIKKCIWIVIMFVLILIYMDEHNEKETSVGPRQIFE